MKSKALYFLKTNKINKLLILNKVGSHIPPNIRTERRDMSVDNTDIKCKIRKYYIRPMSQKRKSLRNLIGFPESKLAK